MFPANMASKSSANRQFKAYKNKIYIHYGNGLPKVSTESHVHKGLEVLQFVFKFGYKRT